jgi:acetyl coenzyme A synthetase (ADP forming)-like protein
VQYRLPMEQSALQTAAPDFPAASSTRALRALLEPRSVAVVGASRTRGTVGAEILHNLIEGFSGAIYPVNPHADSIEGRRAYPRILDVPGEIDLAVIAVPAELVEAAVDECIDKHVAAVVVISAGFSETGAEGKTRETRLRDKLRNAGSCLVGPNCMGVLNTDPARPLNATFSPVFPPAGPVAFSTQSGALGIAVLESARQLNLGLSSFVSVGNKADISTNDLIEYWEGDSRTSVILMYVESFGNPRRFADIARRVGRVKPIVAVKAGRSRSGARAASSHTGALAANDDMVDALFRDTGVIRTGTVEEMFETATLLAHQPLPAGPRVAILTNAGGPGILAADACEAHGLALGTLAPGTREALREFLPPTASLSNPVDMIATASAADYRRAIPLLLRDPGIDSLLTIFIPPIVTRPADVARAIADTTREAGKPVLATFFGAAGVPDLIAPVPCYTFPESAARALAHAVKYARWRNAPAGLVPALSHFDREGLAQIIGRARFNTEGWLEPLAVAAVLERCGISAAATRVVVDASGALAAARQLGFPVVLKGTGPQLLHKTEAHAVFTGLATDEDVLRAHHALARRPDVESVLVQPMIKDGVEMFVGATVDPTFGPVVMCGSGGTMVELLKDTALRLAPLTDRGAREMIDELRGSALLRGFRGSPAADEAAFRDVLLRTSALVAACPGIAELDFNPVIVTTAGAIVVDARIRIAAAHGFACTAA